MVDKLEKLRQATVSDLLLKLESKLNADVFTYYGEIVNGVQRMVDILRHFYSEVNFIIPDYAYSAGTIWCMSGDNIYMNYYSSLGPIDPQVQSKDGKLVAALGYLDKINELLEKARKNELSQAEFLIS